MLSKLKLNQLYFKDTSFVNLMTKRIFNVLLVANPYDAFMLEDDGRIDEKIFNEYMNLSLRYPPRFTQVSTEEAAWKQLENTTFDLVICMPGSDNNDTFDIARGIKEKYTHIPLVVLTPFSHGITARMEHEDLSIFEYVFCWLGNTDLLVSIIKLIEDKMNLEHDIKEVGVQMILLVEDSIRFYSSVLPNLYKFVLQQSQEFATEALNAHQRTLRMRGRPKIVLARTYEEAMDLYNKYANNVLGVITDARYPRAGEVDPMAGIKLLAEICSRKRLIVRIFQQTGGTDGYRRFHYIKEYKEVFYQPVRQLGTEEGFQYRIIIGITQCNLVKPVGIHKFIEDVGTKDYRLRNNHSGILKLIKFNMVLYHIIYKCQATPFSSQRTLTNAGKVGIAVETVTLEYGNHTLILHLTIFHYHLEDNPAMGINILQGLPSYLLQELGRRKHSTGIQPARNVVTTDMIQEGFFGNGKDYIL